MHRLLAALVIAALAALPVMPAAAQMLNAQAPVRVGHYHLNVSSVDDHKKFWVETLGGTATKVGAAEAVKFGDVLLILRPQKPAGPTRGTTFDHIGFAVPNVPNFTKAVVARGYQLTVGRELPGQKPPDSGPSAVYGAFSYLVGPDGVKVELVTNKEPNAPAIVHHHVHFTNPQYVQMGEWYMKALDATLRPGQTDFFFGADLPGIGYMLNFFKWEMNEPLVGTAGRAVDHVGFEVRNLEAFAKALDAKGIKVATPYRRDPALNNVGTVTLVDPWGTAVELTEGLDKAL
jgi:catechol 2,3-dioxygenase-like lactoylglutathione lyase family enzyme